MGRKGLRKYLALVVLLTGCGVGIGDHIWARQLQRSAVQMKEKTDRNQTGEKPGRVILEKNVEAVSVTDIVRVEDNEKKKDKFVAENTGIAVVVNAGTEQFEQEIPVLRVKPHEFTAGDLKAWHDALFPDITLYEYFGIEEREAAYRYHNMDYLLGEIDEDVLPEAGEEHDLKFKAAFHNNEYDYELQSVERTVEGEKLHYIEASRYGTEQNPISYQSCTREEAEELAGRVIKALSLSHEEWRLTDAWSEDDQRDSCCHAFTYSRYYEGVRGETSLSVVDEKKAIGFTMLSEEYIKIRIENGVVTEVELRNPMDVIKVEERKPQILSKDEIYECFKKEFQLRDMKKTLSDQFYEMPDGRISPDYQSADVKLWINRLSMGLCPIRSGDSEEELLMVPVWIFEGTWTVDEHWQNSNVPVMVLNALDGSVVEENPGYRSY